LCVWGVCGGGDVERLRGGERRRSGGGGGGGGGGEGNCAKLKRFGGVFLDFQPTTSMYRLGLE